MDIVHWKVSFKLDTGDLQNTAGPAISVMLSCRVCNTECFATHGVAITPAEVESGQPGTWRSGEGSWFTFAVNSRLAHTQYVCENCGVISKIPPTQAQSLLHQADRMVNRGKLVNAIDKLNVQVRHVSKTEHRQAYEVYAGCNGSLDEYDLMAWCDFVILG